MTRADAIHQDSIYPLFTTIPQVTRIIWCFVDLKSVADAPSMLNIIETMQVYVNQNSQRATENPHFVGGFSLFRSWITELIVYANGLPALRAGKRG